jgi:Xaa-Pro aminopeptidase
VEVIKAGLLKLGLITDAAGDQYKMWYTHGSTHYIGLDVHDVGDRRAPLVPACRSSIEPGIYIRQSALDGLPRTPENTRSSKKFKPRVKKYADIGVRIEDSFLLEETGLRRLSAVGSADDRGGRGVPAEASASRPEPAVSVRLLKPTGTRLLACSRR